MHHSSPILALLIAAFAFFSRSSHSETFDDAEVRTLLNKGFTKGNLMGQGIHKKAFTVLEDKRFVLLQSSGLVGKKAYDTLRQEARYLSFLQGEGLRTPWFHPSVISARGVPSILMERLTYSSKTHTDEFARLINAQSIKDMADIQQTITEQKLDIGDVHLLINDHSRVALADPDTVRKRARAVTPSHSNNVVSHLRNYARVRQIYWMMYFRDLPPTTKQKRRPGRKRTSR